MTNTNEKTTVCFHSSRWRCFCDACKGQQYLLHSLASPFHAILGNLRKCDACPCVRWINGTMRKSSLPPSQITDCPVMFLARGLARNETKLAISSGVYSWEQWELSVKYLGLILTEGRLNAERSLIDCSNATPFSRPRRCATLASIFSHILNRVSVLMYLGMDLRLSHVCGYWAWTICWFAFSSVLNSTGRDVSVPLTYSIC